MIYRIPPFTRLCPVVVCAVVHRSMGQYVCENSRTRGSRGRASKRRHRELWLKRIGAAWAVAHQGGVGVQTSTQDAEKYCEKCGGMQRAHLHGGAAAEQKVVKCLCYGNGTAGSGRVPRFRSIGQGAEASMEASLEAACEGDARGTVANGEGDDVSSVVGGATKTGFFSEVWDSVAAAECAVDAIVSKWDAKLKMRMAGIADSDAVWCVTDTQVQPSRKEVRRIRRKLPVQQLKCGTLRRRNRMVAFHPRST